MIPYGQSAERVRHLMMELWKDTFHDSDRYIRLVFDAYFSPDNVYVRMDGEKLIAALLCVSYGFRSVAADGSDTMLRGMYLCGLATRPECRGRGIMSALMKEAEADLADRGYDMTFLIPADSGLRAYYARMGYFNASYRDVENIGFSEMEVKYSIHSIKRLLERGEIGLIGKVAQWCVERERERIEPTMLHSVSDMVAVMAENENSFFLTDPSDDPEYSNLVNVTKNIKAVVFPDAIPGSECDVSIAGIYFRRCDYEIGAGSQEPIIPEKLRSILHKIFPSGKLSYLCPVQSLLLHANDRVEPYAMIKYLRGEDKSGKEYDKIFNISLMLD